MHGELIMGKKILQSLQRKRSLFVQVTKTKKTCLKTLITTFPVQHNRYYYQEIQAEVIADG